MSLRFDAARLGSVRRTPQGGVRVPATLTRVGVLEYRLPDGSVRKEYRPADEVFRQDSLSQLDGAPVTEGHQAMVTSDNWRQFSVGHVADGTVRGDSKFIQAELVLQDASIINRVDSGELSELSCGYRVDFDPTPGEYEGQRYDGIQRNIRYNHVALLPKGGGRAGRDVGLRLDSNAAVADVDSDIAICDTRDSMNETQLKARIAELESELAKVRTDSVEETKKLQAELDKAQARLDAIAATPAPVAVVETPEQEQVRLDALLVKYPAKVEALVSSRVDLLTKARAVLGSEYKFDGKSDREIMVACVRVDAKEFDGKDRSDDYVRARFDVVTERGVRADSISALPSVIQTVKNSTPVLPDPKAARAAMVEANRNAWQKLTK